MANRLSYDELRALPVTQLEARTERLASERRDATRQDCTLDKPARDAPEDAYSAARSMLDSKKNLGVALNAQRGCKENLSKTYFRMSEEQLMDAYDHVASEQRKLFQKYIWQVVSEKDGMYSDGGSTAQDLAQCLEGGGWPSVETAMQTIDNLPFQASGGGWTTLREQYRKYNEGSGYESDD